MPRHLDPDSHRRKTDDSLREERSRTDELLEPERDERLVEVIRETRSEAESQLRDARQDADEQLEKQADRLPEISEKLERVAEDLSKASTGIVTDVAHIAREVKAMAGSAAAPVGRAEPDAPGTLAGQLAEIADGIAEITSTLAEERRDADRSLTVEREVTDRLVVQGLKQVERHLEEEVREERQVLQQERQATDEDLAYERRSTDEAVEHVQALLVEEQSEHARTARGVATRNEFLAIVSHDLRAPLATILGVVGLMDQQAQADENGQRLRVWADRVRRSVDVMDRLIGDLLDFSSFEDGQLQVAAESLDIRSLIHESVDAFQAAARGRGLSIAADLPDEPLMTKYDPHRMQQVLANLVQNAIKFTPEGGSIRIGAARAGRFCQISISDTGVGIPDGELKTVFERFRQLNPAGRTGLGLGLYISRWIVEAHGGDIWAESRVGAGTTFHFTLPEDR